MLSPGNIIILRGYDFPKRVWSCLVVFATVPNVSSNIVFQDVLISASLCRSVKF